MNKLIGNHSDISIDGKQNNKQFFIVEVEASPQNNKIIYQPIHRHPYHEILLVTQGEGEIDVDFKRYTLKRGSICLFSPFQIHHPLKASNDYKVCLIRFYPSIFENSEFFDEINVFDYDFINLQEHHYMRLKMLLQELIIEFNSEQTLKNYAMGNLFKCMLITIQRAIPETIFEKSSDNNFSKLNSLIVENKFKIFKPRDYAKQLKISERALNTIIKNSTGQSAGEYIRSKTNFEAQRLLLFSTESIKEIAYTLGFDDISYFSRFFKKLNNKSPQKYREDFKD